MVKHGRSRSLTTIEEMECNTTIKREDLDRGRRCALISGANVPLRIARCCWHAVRRRHQTTRTVTHGDRESSNEFSPRAWGGSVMSEPSHRRMLGISFADGRITHAA